MRSFRRLAAAIAIAGAMALGSVAPASAAIHEKVASFCSGGHGNLDPGGQERFGSQWFLRALTATGMYTIRSARCRRVSPDPTRGRSLSP